MARLLAALLPVLLLVGQSSDAAPSEAEAFWRAVLPDSPLPDSILQLLHPDTNSVNEAQDTDAQGRRTVRHLSSPFFYRYSFHKHSSLSPSGAGSSNSVHEAQDTDAQGRRTVRRLSNPFFYRYGSHKHSSSGQSGADDTTADDAVVRAFFHEEALHVGANMTFYFPPAARAPLGLLPRSAADSIPFSTSSLPAVLSLLGIAGDSAEAAGMRETLEMCESEPVAGEAQFCAASLEALVEGAMAALGTRGIRPVTSALPSSGAPLQPYAIRALRRVAGSSFVSCHDMEYPYTVYMCHATGSTRAYVADLEGAGEKATVVTVCHTDTTMWDPEHVSFRILGTKPGGAPVCHFLPYGHIMWAKNTMRSSAA